MLNALSKYTGLQKVILAGLFCCSALLVILRTIWLYDPPYAWIAYQVWHLALFVSALWLFENYLAQSNITIVAISFFIAFIPYNVWYYLIAFFDESLLSNLTSNLHISLRIAFEFGFYFVLQLMIFWGCLRVIKKSE